MGGEAVEQKTGIKIKSPKDLATMREAGQIVAQILDRLKAEIRPGLATIELDRIVENEAARHGATPSFKGYRGYPASVCVSVNEQIVHGIPGQRHLEEGDIVALDVGVIYNVFQGDAAITVGVGRIDDETQRLIDVTREALEAGIAASHEGAYLGDVSHAIQKCVEKSGFSVVREYVGHGIGKSMHEEPQIPNFGEPGTGPKLQKGMVLALEPMVNVGDWHTKVGEDNWTVSTADDSLSAHFEHTVAITDGAPEVLTRL